MKNAPEGLGFVVDLEGFEGPLDVLLLLAREQKVDMANISILALAEQYLVFIDRIRHTHLDIAAEYLVMAAWLAYLKSQLLLPQEEADEDGLTPHLQAEILAWRLARLQAMRDASDRLWGLSRLGVDVLARGNPEGIRLIRSPLWRDTLYDVARAYALQKAQQEAGKAYRVERVRLMTIEQAYKLLAKQLKLSLSWQVLESGLPAVHVSSYRSVLASTFTAMLMMAKDGMVELRQKAPFAPIQIRARQHGEHAREAKKTHAA